MTDREIMQQALEAAPLSDYSKADGDFYKWWYSHMQNDLMQPPLNEVGYRVARYIWDAALRSRLAQPEQERPSFAKWTSDYVQDNLHKLKPEHCQCPECRITPHASDCAVHNEPAYPKGACNCQAQPEQEPVFDCPRCGHCCPQRKPLTDEEIGKIAGETLDPWSCARAIEAAHGIKENT